MINHCDNCKREISELSKVQVVATPEISISLAAGDTAFNHMLGVQPFAMKFTAADGWNQTGINWKPDQDNKNNTVILHVDSAVPGLKVQAMGLVQCLRVLILLFMLSFTGSLFAQNNPHRANPIPNDQKFQNRVEVVGQMWIDSTLHVGTTDVIPADTTPIFMATTHTVKALSQVSPTQFCDAVGTCAWGLSGNAMTAYGSNFIGTTDAQGIWFKTNSNPVMHIDSLSNINLFDNTGANYITFDQNDYQLIFQTGANFKMVTGAGLNKILTSDANGSASWQNLIYDGTYTPTDSAESGVSSISFSVARYSVSGNIVSVWGEFTITQTGGFSFDIDLPVASTLSHSYELSGTGAPSNLGTALSTLPCYVIGNSYQKASFGNLTSAAGAGMTFTYNFQYVITP